MNTNAKFLSLFATVTGSRWRPANGFTLFHRATGSCNMPRNAVMRQRRRVEDCRLVNMDVNNAWFKHMREISFACFYEKGNAFNMFVESGICTQCVLVSNMEWKYNICLQGNSTGHLLKKISCNIFYKTGLNSRSFWYSKTQKWVHKIWFCKSGPKTSHRANFLWVPTY